MPKSTPKPSLSRSTPFTRIQTAEGWKRSLIRKRKSIKASSKR